VSTADDSGFGVSLSSRAYNGPTSEFVRSVLVPTEKLYRSEWEKKYSAEEMSADERRAMRECLGRVMKVPEAGWFAVDSKSRSD
jgi:hypothetical protein